MYLSFPPYLEGLGKAARLYYATFGKAFARKAVSVITDSEHAKRDMIRLWQIPSEKIGVIPLGVGERYRPVQDNALLKSVKTKLGLPDKYVLYLGNFKPHKNVASLVLAFEAVHRRFPEYRLVLAGPLDENGVGIKKMVEKKELTESVIFTDTVREEDHPEALLSMADLFVFPTLYEGFGLPPLEAMACGTPVIASDVTAVPEVVGSAGLMVNPRDVREISNAISALLADPRKREEYSKRGMERAKNFSEEKTAGGIYRHLLRVFG
jgi:glycosyltransferase involved in cell wall biosynthesis